MTYVTIHDVPGSPSRGAILLVQQFGSSDEWQFGANRCATKCSFASRSLGLTFGATRSAILIWRRSRRCLLLGMSSRQLLREIHSGRSHQESKCTCWLVVGISLIFSMVTNEFPIPIPDQDLVSDKFEEHALIGYGYCL